MCLRLEQGTLEMEVRETQSCTAVVKYAGQDPMDGEVHWDKNNMASALTAANMVAVTPKVR